jgi:predicted phosphodiesterase
VLDRLAQLDPLTAIVGNTDVYVRSGMRPRPFPHEVQADPSLLPAFEEVALSIGWTQGAVATNHGMAFLDALPLDARMTLPDGTRVLCVHAEPGKENGRGLRPNIDMADLTTTFDVGAADLIFVGHTHWPTNVQLGATHAVNVGSVGNPIVQRLPATYVLLDADDTGYRVRHRLVPYDVKAALAHLESVRFSAPDYPASFLRGERVHDWPLPPVEYADQTG